MSNAFTPEPSLQQAALKFAEDAVAFAGNVMLMRPPTAGKPGHVTVGDFRIQLDYSDQSIRDVEDILAELHRGLAAAKPSPDQIERFSMMFGSYIGETFRRNHDATWGITPENTGKTPSMRSNRSGTVFFPWTRAYNRITKGDEEDIVVYYQYLLDELKGPSQPPSIPVPPRIPVPPPLPGKNSPAGT